MAENAKNSKLTALFNALNENDKDIVISMTESLVENCKTNTARNVNNVNTKPGDFTEGTAV